MNGTLTERVARNQSELIAPSRVFHAHVRRVSRRIPAPICLSVPWNHDTTVIRLAWFRSWAGCLSPTLALWAPRGDTCRTHPPLVLFYQTFRPRSMKFLFSPRGDLVVREKKYNPPLSGFPPRGRFFQVVYSPRTHVAIVFGGGARITGEGQSTPSVFFPRLSTERFAEDLRIRGAVANKLRIISASGGVAVWSTSQKRFPTGVVLTKHEVPPCFSVFPMGCVLSQEEKERKLREICVKMPSAIPLRYRKGGDSLTTFDMGESIRAYNRAKPSWVRSHKQWLRGYMVSEKDIRWCQRFVDPDGWVCSWLMGTGDHRRLCDGVVGPLYVGRMCGLTLLKENWEACSMGPSPNGWWFVLVGR